MNTTDTMQQLIRNERRDFVATLESLADDQWQAPSLCTEWRIVDVAAHLAWRQ